MFQAFYEDAAKLEQEARKRGWTNEADGSYLDFVDPAENCILTRKSFSTKAAAIRWLKAEIKALHTAFGVGEIIEAELVESRNRCQYCICQGNKPVHRYIVSDIGIEDEEAAENQCFSDDD